MARGMKIMFVGVGVVFACLLIAAVAIGVIVAGDEISDSDMTPPEAEDVVRYESKGFGSSMRCLRCRISKDDFVSFANQHKYPCKLVENLNCNWTNVGQGIFDGLKEACCSRKGFLHSLPLARRRRLRSGAVEGRLEFIYDIEKECLYVLYMD